MKGKFIEIFNFISYASGCFDHAYITVASESTFTIGGRTISDFRSSLTPRMVQSFVCAQDWMSKTTKAIDVEESPDDMRT